MKNPRRASVRAETRTNGTDSKNWRAAGLEPTTLAPSRTIATYGNC